MESQEPNTGAPSSTITPPYNDDEELHTDHNDTEQQQEEEGQSCLSLLRNALSNPDQLTAMISNYSTSYNAVNVGIVLPVLQYSIRLQGWENGERPSGASSSASAASFWNADWNDWHYESSDYFSSSESISDSISAMARRRLDDAKNDDNTPNAEEEDEQDSLVASSLLAGMIFGQLIGGFLGDVFGRRNAMMFVMLLQIGGSLGSALFISTEEETTGLTALEQLALWRFVLGIGAGGVYPLAAVMSAENKVEDDDETENEMDMNDTNVQHEGDDCHSTQNGQNGQQEQRCSTTTKDISNNNAQISSFQRIALTFSTQGLGFITVPLLAYPMLEWNMNIDAIWRVLLGVGALPGIWVLYLRLFSTKVVGNKRRGRKRNDYEEGLVDESDENKREDTINSNNKNEGPITTHKSSSSSSQDMGVELPSSKTNNGQDVTIQDTVSTLFGDNTRDYARSPSHELPLVQNSHLSSDNDDEEDGQQQQIMEDFSPTGHKPRRSLLESIMEEPNLGRKFAGTAGTWFLFDVTFYGNTLFEPFVLEAAFGSPSDNATNGYELLQSTVRDSLVISLLSLPAYFITVLLIGRRTCVCRSLRSSTSTTRCGSASCFGPFYQTPQFIQMQGFAFMFLLYIIIGRFWDSLSSIPWLLLLLYAGTFFFANYGPNTTTFMMPSVTYSEDCRSTLNGISAAAGKIGALVGASMFEPAADRWGESVVMVCCGCLSLVALVLTRVCLGGGKV
eukprot:CAMPEP_0183716202 /NCGR_PEP_ID=MMETSP0737-20130205/10192_1 /TAXON_ID=385413 /ORGANISM="Thalassiosira miniscula, Strain CCMP1093" /LENGTH=733 /DNA_ID=CAMNT_0025945435 /DNA_START=192 /DNA_END=2393 /DNA_ORIENTATION=+